MPPSSSSSSASLIKGYLPVRFRVPKQPQLLREKSDDEINTEDTFFFIREDTSAVTTKRGTTLFVANVPVIPGVYTKCLLKSIFGRFAVVKRVIVVENPRFSSSSTSKEEDSAVSRPSLVAWSDDYGPPYQPTFLPPILSNSEGKYAHIVFSCPKELKKAKNELEKLMTKRRSHIEDQTRALIIDKLEIQTLFDESQRQYNEIMKKKMKWDGSSGNCIDDEYGDRDDDVLSLEAGENYILKLNKFTKHGGILAVANRYLETNRLFQNRSKLMDECNYVMQAYEDAEEAKKKAQELAKSEPDDDGFVTVTYSSAVGSKIELETETNASRRKGNKRSRKKRAPIGSHELKDFYRFQRKDNRKRVMEDLRKQFEEDVRKVKRMKEEKEYRPF